MIEASCFPPDSALSESAIKHDMKISEEPQFGVVGHIIVRSLIYSIMVFH